MTTPSKGIAFSLGLQFPSVLHAALATVLGSTSVVGSAGEQGLPSAPALQSAMAAAHKALGAAYADIIRIARAVEAAEPGNFFKGIDGSLAPLPSDATSITDSYALLGVPYFGAPGTLQASAYLTAVLKSAPMPEDVPLLGYTGLMLAPMEDKGLARDACEQKYGIVQLLACSSVCGVGLDTVPLPGDASAAAISAIIADTAALAWRLDKPGLSVRCFPCPGLTVGDMTAMTNVHLCNTRVFSL